MAWGAAVVWGCWGVKVTLTVPPPPSLCARDNRASYLASVARSIPLQVPASHRHDLGRGGGRTRLGAALFPPNTDAASAGAAICLTVDCHTWRAKVRDAQRYHPGRVLHPIRESHPLWHISRWVALFRQLGVFKTFFCGNADSQQEPHFCFPPCNSYLSC